MLPKIYEGKDKDVIGIRMDDYHRIKLPDELIEKFKIEDGLYDIALIQRYQKGLMLVSKGKSGDFKDVKFPFMLPNAYATTVDKRGRLKIPVVFEDSKFGRGEMIKRLLWGSSGRTRVNLFLELGLDKKDFTRNKLIVFGNTDGIEIWERERWKLEEKQARIYVFDLNDNSLSKFSDYYFIENDLSSIYSVRRSYRAEMHEKKRVCVLESTARCVLVTSYPRLRETLRHFGEIEETEIITPLDMHYTVPFGMKIKDYGKKIITKFHKSSSIAKRESIEENDRKEIVVCEFEKKSKDLYLLKTKSIVRRK